MENNLESLESKVSETRNVIQEFGVKISQALEAEKKKLKEQAEEEAKQIIAKAKEEAGKFIVQARQESEIEANKFLDKIKEKAEQILRESREKAIVEARQESARIVNETREKAVQVIRNIIESDVARVVSEYAQVTAAAKSKLENETSQVSMIMQNIERIIDETQINMQTKVEQLTSIISETGDRLQSLNEHSPESVQNIPQAVIRPLETENTEEPENLETTLDSPQANEGTEAVVPEKTEEPETLMDQPQASEETGNQNKTESEVLETGQTLGDEVKIKNNGAGKTESHDDINKQLQEGINLLDAGKKEEALDILAKVIETEPENALAWRKLGTALGMQGRYMEALKALRRATDLAPQDITAWHNTKIILEKLGQKKEAREAKETEKQLIREYPEQYKEVLKKSK